MSELSWLDRPKPSSLLLLLGPPAALRREAPPALQGASSGKVAATLWEVHWGARDSAGERTCEEKALSLLDPKKHVDAGALGAVARLAVHLLEARVGGDERRDAKREGQHELREQGYEGGLFRVNHCVVR